MMTRPFSPVKKNGKKIFKKTKKEVSSKKNKTGKRIPIKNMKMSPFGIGSKVCDLNARASRGLWHANVSILPFLLFHEIFNFSFPPPSRPAVSFIHRQPLLYL